MSGDGMGVLEFVAALFGGGVLMIVAFALGAHAVAWLMRKGMLP